MSINMKALMTNNQLSLQQKLLTFMMFSDPNSLPNNPNTTSYDELGKTIKQLVDDSVISLDGFNENFDIQITKHWEA